MPKIKRGMALSLALIVLLLFSHTAMAAQEMYTRDHTHLRETASESAKSLMIILGGEKVTILSKTGAWYRVQYGSRKGYIRADLLVEVTKSGYIPLELGNHSKQVKALQQQLYDLGYFRGTIDGEYLEDTKEAVSAFQAQNGIKNDGIAGGETQRTLYSIAAKSADGTKSSAVINTGAQGQAVAGSALKRGDTGDDVKAMQVNLKALGYIAFEPDGTYGVGTEAAVKLFQQNNGLLVDGKAGAATLSLLSAASKSNTTANTPVFDDTTTSIKRGDTGDAVKQVQLRLQALGYIAFTPDGVLGSGTEKAIVEFQSNNGLRADGKVGAQTLAALNSSSAVRKNSTTPTATPAGTATLKRGDTGAEVTKMQKRLRELGYITFGADGTFGSGTRDGVIAFQKKNGLLADGIAGASTLNHLYSSSAIKATSTTVATPSGGSSTGSFTAPNGNQIKLLHFFTDVKPKYPSGTVLTVYDPDSHLTWRLKTMSMGRHADSEPLAADDTATMNSAFGNKTTWTPKAIWVKFPDGTWSMATMHNTPHLSSTIKGNNFDGHLCVHFLRDMDEATKNDPNYGVQNQNALRAAWRALTGQTVK
ncbi:hypothetical protein FACS18948_1560 [Clostridia bacterium]|nr:hypothetical protein FACS18948_1560 [Clostridia bacterium]